MNNRQHKLIGEDVGRQQRDDEQPPVLEPEPAGVGPSRGTFESSLGSADQQYSYAAEERGSYVRGDYYMDDSGLLYQKKLTGPNQHPSGSAIKYHGDTKIAQYSSGGGGPLSSIDDTNICCGLCGEIVPYDALITEHLPVFHPEILKDGIVDLEEIPYETWLNERMMQEQCGTNDVPFRMPTLHPQNMHLRPVRSTRQLRRISQYRVNTAEMKIPELELALQKKMVEKMGRKVPVTLVDKLHAKCGLCNTVISLNKKFEIVHLVRHFNAWHPSSHKCAGTWPNSELPSPMSGKPLSLQDFAVIDTEVYATENLQCIWCGMFLSVKELGMHFHEVHPEEIEVPKCNLCMQELLINARLSEKYGEDFGVTLPSEHSFRSLRFKKDFKSEIALEKAIVKYYQRLNEGADPSFVDVENLDMDSEDEEDQALGSCDAFANSRMICGRRAKPKRKFMMPIVRQAAPKDSQFVVAITHSHWKCKLCRADIYAAVISAGVIKHYKKFHPTFLPNVQFELCKARLEKISGGKMEFVSDELIECSLCSLSFPVTPPFNICRALRHIKLKHPEVMPEHRGGETTWDGFTGQQHQYGEEVEAFTQEGTSSGIEDGVIYATEVTDFQILGMLRQNYSVSFEKVFSVYGRDIMQQIYILCKQGDELDAETVEQIAKVKDLTQNPMVVQLNKIGDKDLGQQQGALTTNNQFGGRIRADTMQ